VSTIIVYWFITNWGAIVGFDSYYYLRAAEGLFSGIGYGWQNPDGMTIMLTHYPPAYPVIIAFFMRLFNIDVLLAAKYVVITVSTLSTLFISIYFYKLTKSIVVSAISILFFLFYPPMIIINASAMSEGVFFLLFFLYLLLVLNISDKSGVITLSLAGLLIAMLFLTRYAAIAILLSFVVYVIFERRRYQYFNYLPYIFGLISTIIPITLWILYTESIIGQVTNRPFVFHPPGIKQYNQAFNTLISWLIPKNLEGSIPFGLSNSKLITIENIFQLLGLLFLVIFVITLFLYIPNIIDKYQFKKIYSSIKIITIFQISYISILILSYTFFDASTSWANRILSPVIITILFEAVLILYMFVKVKFNRLVKTLCVVGIIIVASQVFIGALIGYRLSKYGEGFTSKYYREANISEKVSGISSNRTVYTNNISILYFNTNLNSISIPVKVNTLSDTKSLEYSTKLATMKEEITNGKATLVLLKPYSDKDGVYPKFEKLTNGLNLFYEDEYIFIYGN
jgi:hypothetical protein